MTLLIFASAQELLSCARAKWNQARYRCEPAPSAVIYPATIGMAMTNRKLLSIRQSGGRTAAVRAVLQINWTTRK